MSDPSQSPQCSCAPPDLLTRPRLRLNIRFMTSAWLTLAILLHKALACRVQELLSAVRYTPAGARRSPGPSTVASLACQTWRDAIIPSRTALMTLAASWGLLRPQPLAQAGYR